MYSCVCYLCLRYTDGVDFLRTLLTPRRIASLSSLKQFDAYAQRADIDGSHHQKSHTQYTEMDGSDDWESPMSRAKSAVKGLAGECKASQLKMGQAPSLLCQHV
jgi:hypothetical protein